MPNQGIYIPESAAAIAENVAFSLVMIICATGIVSLYWRRNTTYEWGTYPMLKAGKVHRYLSLFTVGVTTGLIPYAIIDNFGATAWSYYLAFGQLAFFLTLWGCWELYYRH